MIFNMSLIIGVSLGIENVVDEDEGLSYWVLDLFIFRFMLIRSF